VDSFKTENSQNPLFSTVFDHEFINEPYWHSTDYSMKMVDENSFIYANETSGHRHIYLQSFDSTNLQVTRPPIQLTSGNWEVNDTIDSVQFSKNKNTNRLEKVYVVGKFDSPLTNNLYEIEISSLNLKRITEPDYSYRDFQLNFDEHGNLSNFIAVRSNLETPHCPIFHNLESSICSKLLDIHPVTDQPLPKPFTFTNSSNVELHGLIYTPANYDPNKTYPVFWHVYGSRSSDSYSRV